MLKGSSGKRRVLEKKEIQKSLSKNSIKTLLFAVKLL